MSEKCCGTCARWESRLSGCMYGRCSLTMESMNRQDGKRCRAYLERGRKTVRMRILVWDDEWGHLAATGEKSLTDTELKDSLCDGDRFMRSVAWIEADVPLPDEPPTVEGMCS